jgi:hypothetical protein
MDFVMTRGEMLSRGFTALSHNFDAALPQNFDLTLGGLHMATWSLGTNSASVLGRRKTTDKLHRVRRS